MAKFLAVALLFLLLLVMAGVDVRGVLFSAGRSGAGGQVSVVAWEAPAPTPVPDAGGEVRGSIMAWAWAIAIGLLLLALPIGAIGAAVYFFVVPAINNFRYARDREYQRSKVVVAMTKRNRGLTNAEAAWLSGVPDQKRAEVEARVEREKIRTEKERVRLENLRQMNQPRIVGKVADLEPTYTIPAFTLLQAIGESKEREWVIGQATERQPTEGFREHGRLVTFDPRTTHVAIIGGTGSGKTASTGLLMALYARKFGVHPIVLDGKEGIDWRSLDGIVEWQAMDPFSIADQINGIMGIFQERWKLLKGTGAPNIYDLPKFGYAIPTPVLIMIEEFGDIWLGLKRIDGAKWKELGGQVDRLFRLARATGITLCLIDQAPEKWSQQMRGNAKFVVCYKLKGGVANAFNEYHVDKLPNVGTFSQDNVFYRAWHTQAEIDLKRMFPPLTQRLLDRVTVVAPTKQVRSQPIEKAPVVQASSRTNTPILSAMTADRAPVEPCGNRPQALVDAEVLYVKERKWDGFAMAWCEAFPNRGALMRSRCETPSAEDERMPPTASDLARAMVDLHNARFPDDLKDWKINFYSQARRLFARYHRAGEPQRVEGVVEQIVRDRAAEQKVEVAQRRGAPVVFNRSELSPPKFLQ